MVRSREPFARERAFLRCSGFVWLVEVYLNKVVVRFHDFYVRQHADRSYHRKVFLASKRLFLFSCQFKLSYFVFFLIFSMVSVDETVVATR